MDPSRTGTSVSARQRRELLKAAVRENVYIKAGKRPPLGRPRGWARWTALTIALPGVAAGALLLLPEAHRGAAMSAPAGVANAKAGVSANARDRGAAHPGAPSSLPSLASPNALAAASPLVGQPRPLDRAVFPVGVRRISATACQARAGASQQATTKVWPRVTVVKSA